jgi:hypothetical protein
MGSALLRPARIVRPEATVYRWCLNVLNTITEAHVAPERQGALRPSFSEESKMMEIRREK